MRGAVRGTREIGIMGLRIQPEADYRDAKY